MPKLQSSHQLRVEEFMTKAGQIIRDRPFMPTNATRVLRVRLLLEEVLEYARAAGIVVYSKVGKTVPLESIEQLDVDVAVSKEPDLPAMIDANADISVVNVGAMSACGVKDKAVLKEVDESNLRKFGPGGYKDKYGKWIKPKDFVPPDFYKVLKEQGWQP